MTSLMFRDMLKPSGFNACVKAFIFSLANIFSGIIFSSLNSYIFSAILISSLHAKIFP